MADGSFAVGVETEVPNEKKVPAFTFMNFALNVILIATQISLLRLLTSLLALNNIPMTVGTLVIMLVLSAFLYNGRQENGAAL